MALPNVNDFHTNGVRRVNSSLNNSDFGCVNSISIYFAFFHPIIEIVSLAIAQAPKPNLAFFKLFCISFIVRFLLLTQLV